MDTNNSFFNSKAFRVGFVVLCVAIGLAILTSVVGGKHRGVGMGGIEQTPHISVSGVGEIEIKPDLASFTFDIRKEAKGKKDFATSDKIRNQLARLGISVKDEKDGGMSYSFD